MHFYSFNIYIKENKYYSNMTTRSDYTTPMTDLYKCLIIWWYDDFDIDWDNNVVAVYDIWPATPVIFNPRTPA